MDRASQITCNEKCLGKRRGKKVNKEDEDSTKKRK